MITDADIFYMREALKEAEAAAAVAAVLRLLIIPAAGVRHLLWERFYKSL